MKVMTALAGSVILGSLFAGSVAFAEPNAFSGNFRGGFGRHGVADRMPGVMGAVSSINGTDLKVTDKRSGTVYAVDASKATVTKNGASSSVSSITAGDTVMVQGATNGTSIIATAISDGIGMTWRGRAQDRGIVGIVGSVNGTTLTITAKTGPNGNASTTYTVNASTATVTKNNATALLSDIAVGTTVVVRGTVSGNAITATTIRGDVMKGPHLAQNSLIKGNGEPIVGGTVSALNNTTLTVTNKSGIAYTVNAASATIEKARAASSLASITVGDEVIIQGTVNGTAVIASSVIDQGSGVSEEINQIAGTPGAHQESAGGFFGRIGGFFQHLFGFF